MRILIYARVSKADKDDPNSIPVQLADCRRRAQEEGWAVAAEEVDEGVSGWKRGVKRRGWERALLALEAGEVDAVLSRDLERLLRSDKEGQRILDLFDKGIVHLWPFADEGDLNLRRAGDRKAFRDRVSSAIYYSDRLSEKARSTLKQRAQDGHWSGGGRRPFGFTVIGKGQKRDGKRAELTICEPEARLIQDAARRVLDGVSLSRVTKEWNGAGIRTSSENRFTLTDVRRILLSPQVAGLRMVDGEAVEAKWPRIISRAQHDLLVLKLTDPARLPNGKPSGASGRRYVLSGLAVCGICGTRLTGHFMRKKRPGGRLWPCRSYVCTTAAGGCGRLGILANRLEDEVMEDLDAHVRSLDLPTPTTAETSTAAPTAQEEELLRELHDLEKRQGKIAEDYATGELKMSAGQFNRANAKLDTEIVGVREKLGALVGTRAPALDWSWKQDMEQTEDFYQRRLAGALTPEEVARTHDYVAAFVEQITVDPMKPEDRGRRFNSDRVMIRYRRIEAVA